MPIDYKQHSPSALNLFAASPALFVLERILKIPQPRSAPMLRGLAVEEGVTYGLRDLKVPVKECLDVALIRYDTDMAMSGDPRREKFRESIEPILTSALDELRKYGTPDEVQGLVEWRPPELRLPIVGFFDYKWSELGILGDLKTTDKMPSQIKTAHARQVALYATSDNIDARLIYVTPRKLIPYQLENVRDHRRALLSIAVRVERFLSLSDDPSFFLQITVPDVDSFYWSNPHARRLAWEHWGV